MPSSHECINQIQHILSAGEAVTKEKVAELVWAYAGACQQVNEKARKCLELLRQGRRAEAQRLAQDAPDLEQELRLLDFPERAAWLDLCETAGLPIGQGLDVDALDGIVQEVYSEGGTLDRLLKTFRRMSIGRAPLADRLRLLRQVRRADPQHDLWLENVRAFEAARQAELLTEGEAADASGDLHAMENILGELKSGEWLSPPVRFIAAIERIIIPHRRRYAMARFAELTGDLHEAHGRMDEQRCRFLLSQVEAVVSQTGVSPDAATEAAIEPVQTWLDQLDAAQREDAAFEAACAALELAIDENKDRLALEKLAGAVFRFERGMPELLAARFNSRMEELGRKAKRRFALTLTGVIGGVLILAGLVTAVIVWQSLSSERERWRGEIASALEKGDLEGAGRLLAGVAEKSPAVAAAPEIEALRREHERKVQEEAGRREEFQGIQKAIEEKGAENPDPKALERAAQLARTLAEKQWVEKWRQKYAVADDDKRRLREDQFRQKLDELKALHAKFSEGEQGRREDLDALATPCLAMAKELAGWTDVSKSLQAEVAAIERHVNQAMKTFQDATGKRQAVREVLARLPSLVDNPDELVRTLEAFVQNYPEHPLAPEFTKAVSMGPHWRAVQAWRLLLQGWQGPPRINDAQVALARHQQVEGYIKQHLGGPLESVAKDYRTYLSAASTAFADGRLIGLAKVKEVLNHPVFTPALRMIRTRDGRAYYILEKDLREQRANDRIMGYTFKHMTSTAPAYAERNLSIGEILEGPLPSPQTPFAKAALARLDAFKGPGWETFYLELAALAQEQKGMDPVLTGQVLQLVLDFAANTTPYRGDQIKQWVGQIGGESLDFVAWLDPNSAGAEKARPRIEQILKSMGSLKSVAADVQKNLDSMFASVSAYSPVGIVLNSPGPIQFGQTPPDGKAYVLWGKPGEAPGFIEIGSIQGGKFAGGPEAVAQYPQGSPVFVRVSK
jgi:hypothetical protein